ncbi:MAG: dihydrodipicolinate synthase family protein [Acidimicrobiales bacterium]
MARYSKREAKEFARERLQGVYSAFCLPETPEGRIDEDGLRRDIRHYIDVIKAAGLYVHGFYGNFWLLTTAERKAVMEIVADESRGAVPIICRCAHQSLQETIDLVHHAESCGADFISLIGPAFGGASEAMVVEYFDRVAAETSLGLSIFNTRQAGYVISPELMARLGKIENVCALKNDVDMAHTIQVRKLAGDEIVVIDPSEERFLVNMTEFGQRAIYTGTNYMFDSACVTPMRDYVEAGLAGDTRLCSELYFRMQPIRDLHHRWVLEPWKRTGLCPISTIKAWTQQLGLTGGPARPPLPPISPERATLLHREMSQVGLTGGDVLAAGVL